MNPIGVAFDGRNPLIIAREQARAAEAAERYRKTGMVAHRRSLAHSGRDPALAEANNLIGSPASMLEKLDFFAQSGVDHVCALHFPHDSVGEMLKQKEWFARDMVNVFQRRNQ